ncbi:MAG: hypothetical protein PHS96_00520 [Anaerolineales bacterium]|nr:hypothetical protein [Anaerolineales bacterium]
MTRLRAIFWPEDLADLSPVDQAPEVMLPPPEPSLGGTAGQEGRQDLPGNLPERNILYPGPGGITSLENLIAAWRWAAGPIGRGAPLLVAGLDAGGGRQLERLARNAHVEDSVRPLVGLTPAGLAAAIRRSSALLHLGAVAP